MRATGAAHTCRCCLACFFDTAARPAFAFFTCREMMQQLTLPRSRVCGSAMMYYGMTLALDLCIHDRLVQSVRLAAGVHIASSW